MAREYIELSKADLLASGDMRDCFVHPKDSAKCIKVDKPRSHKPATLIEAAYFQRIYRIRKGQFFEYISNYYSLVDTNFGIGSIYDLIRHEDTGKVSETLLNVMINQPDLEDEIDTALIRLKHQMCHDPIIVRDLRPWNICAQRLLNGSISLKVIDGFGHRFFFSQYVITYRLSPAKLQ